MIYNDDFVLMPDQMFEKMAKEYSQKLAQKSDIDLTKIEAIQLCKNLQYSYSCLQAVETKQYSCEVVDKIADLKIVVSSSIENLKICYEINNSFFNNDNNNKIFNNNLLAIISEIISHTIMLKKIEEKEKRSYQKNILNNNQKKLLEACGMLVFALSKNGYRFFKHF